MEGRSDKDANPDMVKKLLMERELTPEDWGGKTVVVPVSALTGQGIDDLPLDDDNSWIHRWIFSVETC